MKLRDLCAPGARDRDIQQELEFHLNALVEDRRKAGLDEEEAHLAARRRLGNTLHIKERGHDVRGAGWIEGVLRDANHAARRLTRAPAFTIAAALTLALAIGANGA